ncbi:hypothetical protein NM688_g7558 [Phlebia brevispora]|uniref:Uncharacterized protein n=1 Tax=Phlebia brevispora TaxID=194682 RepID=A0ACC1S3W8_9APHY|nr:hypothetical protein NM688_g7558 [Phlebia brevispora]
MEDLTPLEALYENNLQILRDVHSFLSKSDGKTRWASKRPKWQKDIKDLIDRRKNPRLMIAVCGASGAGKSSLINTLLGATVVPTSGLRACTAVPISVEYHADTQFKAVITFLSRGEWQHELKTLLENFRNEEGNIVEVGKSTDADVQVARDKVVAVYPQFKQIVGSRERIAQLTVESLMVTNTAATEYLDSTKTIYNNSANLFSKDLRKYVQGVVSKKSKEGDTWPLVKKVEIFCDCPLLACGAVLVDLPGTGDSNKARDRVAAEYMTQCERYWVVAPIERILDSESVQDLISEGLKMQLARGTLLDKEAITVIATKSEGVTAETLINDLDLHDDEGLLRIDERIGQLEEELDQSDEDSLYAKGQSPRAMRQGKRKQLGMCKRERNTYCATKRTAYVQEQVKQQVYEVLIAYNAEVGSPFSGPGNADDFELKVFCTSSHDYDAQKGRGASYFATLGDTQIPALQTWVKELTIPGRKEELSRHLHSAGDILRRINSAVTKGITACLTDEQNLMHNLWSSPEAEKLARIKTEDHRVATADRPSKIRARLQKEFYDFNQQTTEELKRHFGHALKDKASNAASAAASEALKVITHKVSPITKWTAFNVLLKCGSYKKGSLDINLNEALLDLYLKKIVGPWGSISQTTFYTAFSGAARKTVKSLLNDIEASAAGRKIQEHISQQKEKIEADAHGVLRRNLKEAKTSFRKSKEAIIRDLAPEVVETKLKEGYEEALSITGKGCLAKRKERLGEFVVREKDNIFLACADRLVNPLSAVADEIGEFLKTKLDALVGQLEDDITKMWETPIEPAANPAVELLQLIERHGQFIAQLDDITSE